MPRVLPSTPAMITAVKPTIIDTRAPKISRDSTSRPMWSVPSRCSVLPPAIHAGGRKRGDGRGGRPARAEWVGPGRGPCAAPGAPRGGPEALGQRADLGIVGHDQV